MRGSVAAAILGFACAAASGSQGPPAAARGEAQEAPAAGARAPRFAMACEGEEMVFAGACTGRFEGTLGVIVFDHRGATWSAADDWMLEQHGMRNVGARGSRAPRKDWTGFHCTATAGVLMELQGYVAGSFLSQIELYDCGGYEGENPNLAVKELDVFVTPQGARIGEVQGFFRGHPDNSVVEGSFHDALVARYGEKNCNLGMGNQFCRAGARTRIEITGTEPGLFHVRIRTPSVREETAAFARQRNQDARKASPVNPF